MANVLVLYGTREGHTAKIATRIAEVLRARGHGVELVDADGASTPLELARFDAACIGGSIHASGYPPAVARFVRQNRAWLERIPSAFFSVGLAVASRTSDGRAETQVVVDRFVKRTGWRPRRIEFIAGALPYTKYNFVIRWIMRRIAAKAGGDTDTSRDYEYTDWSQVERFASDVVAELPRRAVTDESPTLRNAATP
jgi:menaquinone-dependent protoporphyrinogen oxidase